MNKYLLQPFEIVQQKGGKFSSLTHWGFKPKKWLGKQIVIILKEAEIGILVKTPCRKYGRDN